MIILVILLYGILAVYEFVPLYKQKLWKDLLADAVLGFFSLTIAVLLSMNVVIPSPVRPIKDLITTIFGK